MPRDHIQHDELVVLTGDLVASSRMTPAELDAAMAALAAAAATATEAPCFTRFRGDGWQCLAPSPSRALRTALLLQAHLRSLGPRLATRIAIGIGPGALPTGGDLATASGAAFELSGRGLDGLGATARLAISWTDPPAGAAWIPAILALCDEISRRWTPRQAEVLAASLEAVERPAQQALAARFGVTQQTVGRLLAAGGRRGIAAALDAVEG